MNKLLHAFQRKGEKNKCSMNWLQRTLLFLVLLLCGFTSGEVIAQTIDFRQASNNNGLPLGRIKWINSILQQNNSVYYEGMGVPQRVVLIEFPTTPGNNHTLTMAHQAVKASSNCHAYDFMMSWAQAESIANTINPPQTLLTVLTGADRCADVIGPPANLGTICETLHGMYFIDIALPDAMANPSPNPGGGNVSDKITAFEATHGNRTIRIYGNQPFTGGNAANFVTFTGYTGSDPDAQYTISWQSASTQLVFEYAGHLASGVDAFNPGVAWGDPFGSANISGGPYHFYVYKLDGASLGSQDNQIKGADILRRPPTCTISPAQSVCAEASSAVFSYTGGTLGATFSWSLTNNTAGAAIDGSNTGSSVTIIPAGADFIPGGSVTVNLAVTTPGGTTNCAVVLTIYPKPVVTANDNNVCIGGSVQLTANPAGGTWSGANINASGLFDAAGLSPGTYNVTYSYTDPQTGCSNTDQATVTVNALPTVVANDASVCTGASVQLTANPAGGTWSGTHVNASGLFNAAGVAPGQYEVTYTYTDANSCTNSDKATVTVNPTTSSFNEKAICANLLPYSWDGLIFNEAGTQEKKGLVNQYGCDSTATYQLTVNPLPVASCSAAPTLIDIMSAAHNTQLDVDLSGNADSNADSYTYSWSHDGQGSLNADNIKNPVYTASLLDAAQTIHFTVVVTNKRTGCSTTSYCEVNVSSIGGCPEVATTEICNGSTNTYTAARAPSASETWKWTVNNGASIVGPDNGQSVDVVAGDQNYTLTLTITYANTDISPTVCPYEVTVISCGGYCTYTQGKYGNKSPACDGDGTGDGVAIKYPSVVEMIKAMLDVNGIGNPLVIGSNGRFVRIPATADAAVLLNKSMPGGSNPRELLVGDCIVSAASTCWTPGTNTNSTYITKQGRINNVLLSQTITLGLNMRVSGGLTNFELQAGTFATAATDGGCGSTIAKKRSCYLNELGQLVVVNEYVYKTIPQSIIDALNCKQYPHTVGGLYQLANDALGNVDDEVGKECGASLGAITDAVASINEGFDECRIFVGWNVGPCEVSPTRLNVNSGAIVGNTEISVQPTDGFKVSAFPNPFVEKVSFVIVSPVSGRASLEVYNMFGQKLQTVYDGHLTAGRTQLVEYRPSVTAAAGTLIYKFSIGGKQITGKLINLKQ